MVLITIPNVFAMTANTGEVRIGSQDDEKFLLSVVEEMGGVDIVLDDGSHQVKHLKKSFNVLISIANRDMIWDIHRGVEDLHTSYWRGCLGGAYGRKSNFWGFVLIFCSSVLTTCTICCGSRQTHT